MVSIPHDERLTIVIPALNEEEAIGKTIARCLEAREFIKDSSGISQVEIIVVSDGSTDRTAAIASEFHEVNVIVFPSNRGYGAAIKEGWRQGSGTLLAFLDADGTCDPRHFAEMCRLSLEESADVVLDPAWDRNRKCQGRGESATACTLFCSAFFAGGM